MQNVAIRHAPEAVLPRPSWLPVDTWPHDAHPLDVDGTRVAYYDVGSGPVLVLVHTGLWSFVWRDVVSRLCGQFRCICIDAPGTGLSAMPMSPPTLEDSARAVSALIHHLGLQELTLVVHDLGGITGIAGAARAGATIRGLVAINAFAWHPTGTALRTMLRLVGSAPLRELDAWTRLVPRITASSFGVGRHLDARSRAAFLRGVARPQIRSFHRYLANALHCESLYRDIAQAFGRLASVPALSIFGERNDPFHFQPEWKRRIPTIEQLVLRRGNHFPMCDDPAFVVNAMLRWHQGVSASRGA